MTPKDLWALALEVETVGWEVWRKRTFSTEPDVAVVQAVTGAAWDEGFRCAVAYMRGKAEGMQG